MKMTASASLDESLLRSRTAKASAVATDSRLRTTAGTFAVVLLALLGLFTLMRSVLTLWSLWRTDPLRSVGIFFPFISLILILRAAHTLRGRLRGTWWGLLPIALAILVEHLRNTMIFGAQISSTTYFSPPRDSPVLCAYACGVVLLFGGPALFRRCLFPLGLLLFLNPVPHLFNTFVDVPLQYASAHLARAFAALLGHPLTYDQLRLMFTPTFGMYIAPGCNGIRGAITMGYIALIAGHLFRFPLRLHALIVTGAVLLGYVFNFLRLCILVVWYVVALRMPGWQDSGKNVDYAIGSSLFTLATILLATVLLRQSRKVKQRDGARAEAPARSPLPSDIPGVHKDFSLKNFGWLRFSAFAALLLFGSIAYARPLLRGGTLDPQPPAVALTELYPARLGDFDRTRVWQEGSTTGAVFYDWAEYRDAVRSETIEIGISPILGTHDALLCHLSRGEDPTWKGTGTFQTPDGRGVAFSTFFYNDGVTQSVEANTLCASGRCGELAPSTPRRGLVVSAPVLEGLLDESAGRAVPILLRADLPDAALPTPEARQHLEQRLKRFVAAAALPAMAAKFSIH